VVPLDLPDHPERMLTRPEPAAIRDRFDKLIDGERPSPRTVGAR